ncbi:unnamed protein product [Linum tenue]|uniref:Uncharacterized protein n=1 Tax=Linum tenue TaxID=586396 RepID=A0AAV0K6X9_9ROSI|nr:unnamed protein product [Linum tenue]
MGVGDQEIDRADGFADGYSAYHDGRASTSTFSYDSGSTEAAHSGVGGGTYSCIQRG